MEEMNDTLANTETFWTAEFARLRGRDDFVEFYCRAEDQWLQFADWDEKVQAIFGDYRSAVLRFKAASL
jgi:hypothetical protein